MKVVFSKKGFDDSYGGMPSPILPDGRLIPLPIPVDNEKADEEAIQYNEIIYDGNGTLSSVIQDLKPSHSFTRAHLDPDIGQFSGYHSVTVPSFGQCGSAEGHLRNQGVGTGDVFLFYGTFRQTYKNGEKLVFAPAHPVQCIWGFMKVDRKIEVNGENEHRDHVDLSEHLHVRNVNKDGYRQNNVVYIGGDSGVFRRYSDTQLTKPGWHKTVWALPSCFREAAFKTHVGSLTGIIDNESEFAVQAATRTQEIVVDVAHPSVKHWIDELLERAENTTRRL